MISKLIPWTVSEAVAYLLKLDEQVQGDVDSDQMSSLRDSSWSSLRAG